MSTFTVTLTANGTVKGRAIAYTTTFDIENVYDFQQSENDRGNPIGNGFTVSGLAQAKQDCPTLIFARNGATTNAGALYMADNGSGITKIIGLSAGQFALLHEMAQGEGIVVSNASASTAIEEVTHVYVDAFPNFHGEVVGQIFTLNTAAS